MTEYCPIYQVKEESVTIQQIKKVGYFVTDLLRFNFYIGSRLETSKLIQSLTLPHSHYVSRLSLIRRSALLIGQYAHLVAYAPSLAI